MGIGGCLETLPIRYRTAALGGKEGPRLAAGGTEQQSQSKPAGPTRGHHDPTPHRRGTTSISLAPSHSPLVHLTPHPKPFSTPRDLLRGLAADRYELCALWFLIRSADGSTSTSSGGVISLALPTSPSPWQGCYSCNLWDSPCLVTLSSRCLCKQSLH